ncbi:MAG: hypothetical protein GY869_05810 [Planctomycetes bacterium]|nr:hypothetical protein [Planctomycetota bacterium]
MFQKYIQLNDKRYAVYGDGYKPGIDLFRVHTVGLTGKTIIQNFKVEQRLWQFKLKVFINDPWPDANYGMWSDLLTAYREDTVTLVEHDDTQSHTVIIDGPLFKTPHVVVNISGLCHGVLDIDVLLTEVLI